jgi:hypothetical protein
MRSTHRFPVFLCSVVLLIALLRIISTYRVLSQAYDEPAHIACGMEWLSKGTYTLEPLHPPLARIAVALGPYLAGLRLPAVRTLPDQRGLSYDIFGAGNEILAKANYFRTLSLARLGVLPFFVLSVVIVFLWTRKLFGDWAAVLAVLAYTNLPPILAFFGVAYTDPALTALVPCTIFAFSNWLEKPTAMRAAIMGLSIGVTILSKFTALLFLPACFLVILAARWSLRDSSNSPPRGELIGRSSWTVLLATLTLILVIWAGFRFSLNRIPKPPQEIAALELLPRPLRLVSIEVLRVAPWVPAQSFFEGIESDIRMNDEAPPSYLFGNIRRGGWWYFFIAAVALKTPLAFLILTFVGVVAIFSAASTVRDWQHLVPLLCVIAMLVVTMPAKINYGVRHVLVIYPLMAIIAGRGGWYLWEYRPRLRLLARAGLCLLLAWQIVSVARVHPDYLSYFNELGSRNSENYLLWGCDLDCGQDTHRLVQVLKNRGIDDVTLCLFTSADVKSLGLSKVEQCIPYQRNTGWFAASIRLIKTGDAFWGGRHRDAYAWLSNYTPVTRIGKTILLYYIPRNTPPAQNSQQRPES